MAKSEKIKDVPVLSSLNGTEKIPTGGRGKFTTTITQISDYISGALVSLINNKVDKVAGKGLSTEDYTTLEKIKLNGIEEGAEVNVNADWNSTSGDSEILNKPDLLQLGETSTTAHRGDHGKIAYDHSQVTSGNPHNVTKSEVGLGNVDNTSDLDKPISTATQTALNTKLEELSSPSLIGTSLTLTKSGVLGRLKKLAVNTTTNNLTVTDNGDYVTLDTNGEPLKFFKEEQIGGSPSNLALYQRNIPTGTSASTIFISGRHSADNLSLNGADTGFYPSFSLFNPKHTLFGAYNIGSNGAAIDLQILRRTDLSDKLEAKTFALGGYNSVYGINSFAVGWNAVVNGSRAAVINSGLGRAHNNGNNTLLINSSPESSQPTNASNVGLYPVTCNASGSLILNRATSIFGGNSGGNFSGSSHLAITSGGSVAGSFNTVLSSAYFTNLNGSSNIGFGAGQSVLTNRGMSNVYVLSLRPALNNQTSGGNSIVKMPGRVVIYSNQANNWQYFTSTENGSQSNLTTTTYKMHVTGEHDSVYFESIIKIRYALTNTTDIIKMVGIVYKNSSSRILNYTNTYILQTISAGLYDIESLLESTDYIRIRMRWNGTNDGFFNTIFTTESYTTYTELGI